MAIYASRWGLTGRAPPSVDWTFTVGVTADLAHQGQPAWAVVDPRVNPVTAPDVLPGGTAHVQIRDIDATPIPGFDGDPLFEIRVTVAHEMGHPVVAEALAMNEGTMNVPAEEHIVETAAQAIVRSEGTPDARVMARAVRALPSALRARISARAPARARGGPMDPEMVMKALNALEGGDSAAALEILKGLIAAAAGAGGAHVEPDGDEAVSAGAAKVAPLPAPGGAVVPEDARRAKGAEMADKDMARARIAADEIEAMAKAARPAAKEALVVGLRARLGSAFTSAGEKRIMAAGDFGAAKLIAEIIEETVGAGGGQQRARSGVEHVENPGAASASLPSVEQLRAEGFAESWLTGYQFTAPDAKAAYLAQGRTSARARVAKPAGGAS